MKRLVSRIGLVVMMSIGLFSILMIGGRPSAANEECKKNGKANWVGGTLICDCTANSSDCQCILPGNCPPNSD